MNSANGKFLSQMRVRLRELGVEIGGLPTGSNNAITDVAGVRVGHATVVSDEPVVLRTGVTMVIPRDDVSTDFVFAAWHNFSGNGEMTGLPWIEEAGLIGSPIGITNTFQVGLVRDFLVRRAVELGMSDAFHLPVVAETWDGWLSEIESFGVTEAHAREALDGASDGPVAEGCVGGGTGMICHEFKGGIGTSSRVVEIGGDRYTVGVLVQANYGRRGDLRVDGRPVGRLINTGRVASPWDEPPSGGSIIVIVATDAPLLPVQCRRLAKRVAVGLGRVGGYGHDSSGDIFLAFSTGNHLPSGSGGLWSVSALPMWQMDALFHATADATEESILNALCAAETTQGKEGRIAHAIPLDLLAEALAD